MSTAARPMTADELLALPSDSWRYELVSGELLRMNPAGGIHGLVVGRLTTLLGQHALIHGTGHVVGAETGFVLKRNPDTVRSPDVAFISVPRLSILGATAKYFSGTPDLAVEVTSPSDMSEAIDEKVDAWLRAGTLEVWVVNPKRQTVTVYRSPTDFTLFKPTETLDGGPLLVGFSCAVADLFTGIV